MSIVGWYLFGLAEALLVAMFIYGAYSMWRDWRSR